MSVLPKSLGIQSRYNTTDPLPSVVHRLARFQGRFHRSFKCLRGYCFYLIILRYHRLWNFSLDENKSPVYPDPSHFPPYPHLSFINADSSDFVGPFCFRVARCHFCLTVCALDLESLSSLFVVKLPAGCN